MSTEATHVNDSAFFKFTFLFGALKTLNIVIAETKRLTLINQRFRRFTEKQKLISKAVKIHTSIRLVLQIKPKKKNQRNRTSQNFFLN